MKPIRTLLLWFLAVGAAIPLFGQSRYVCVKGGYQKLDGNGKVKGTFLGNITSTIIAARAAQIHYPSQPDSIYWAFYKEGSAKPFQLVDARCVVHIECSKRLGMRPDSVYRLYIGEGNEGTVAVSSAQQAVDSQILVEIDSAGTTYTDMNSLVNQSVRIADRAVRLADSLTYRRPRSRVSHSTSRTRFTVHDGDTVSKTSITTITNGQGGVLITTQRSDGRVDTVRYDGTVVKGSIPKSRARTDGEDDSRNCNSCWSRFWDRQFEFRSFRAHWVGVDLGVSMLLSPQGNLTFSDDLEPFSIQPGKSVYVALNFLQKSIPIQSTMGLVIGLGFSWCNYRFTLDNTISIADGKAVADFSRRNQGYRVNSTWLHSGYLTLPLLFELQNGQRSWRRVHFSAGLIGGLRIYNVARLKYSGGKDSESGNLYLNNLQLIPTLRFGIGYMKFFVNFYPFGLFQSNRGPKVYPLDVGLTLLSF